jgi:hypothetical protein
MGEPQNLSELRKENQFLTSPLVELRPLGSAARSQSYTRCNVCPSLSCLDQRTYGEKQFVDYKDVQSGM